MEYETLALLVKTTVVPSFCVFKVFSPLFFAASYRRLYRITTLVEVLIGQVKQ
jgi:hypothetical protein